MKHAHLIFVSFLDVVYRWNKNSSSHTEYTLYHVYISTQQCTQEYMHAYQYPVCVLLLIVTIQIYNSLRSYWEMCLFAVFPSQRCVLWCYHMWICVIYHSDMWTDLMRCYHMWRFNTTNSTQQDNECEIRSRDVWFVLVISGDLWFNLEMCDVCTYLQVYMQERRMYTFAHARATYTHTHTYTHIYIYI